MRRLQLSVFGAGSTIVIGVGMLTYFLWNVAIDAGLHAFTSPRVFVGILLVSAIAPLPFTLPVALLGGVVAATLVSRADADRFRGDWIWRGLKWGSAIGATVTAGALYFWNLTAPEAVAGFVPIGTSVGGLSGSITGAYCERALDSAGRNAA